VQPLGTQALSNSTLWLHFAGGVSSASSSARGANTALPRLHTVPAGCCSALVRSYLAQPHETTNSTPSKHETATQRTCSVLHSLEDTKSLCRPHDDATSEDSLMALRVLHSFSKDPLENLLQLPRPFSRRALRRNDVRLEKHFRFQVKEKASCVEQGATIVKNNNTKLRSLPAFTRGSSAGYHKVYDDHFHLCDLAREAMKSDQASGVFGRNKLGVRSVTVFTSFESNITISYIVVHGRSPRGYDSRKCGAVDVRTADHCLHSTISSSATRFWAASRGRRAYSLPIPA